MDTLNKTMSEGSSSSSTMIIEHLRVEEGKVLLTPRIGEGKT